MNQAQKQGVFTAMRHIQSETERWILADALFEAVPHGEYGLGDLLEEAKQEGVAGKLSVTTLRLYRDTANRWPVASRIPGVSFSAHREAEKGIKSLGATQVAKILQDMADANGPDKVTITAVRAAIAGRQGKSVTPKSPATFDAVADLKKGGGALIKTITASMSVSDLEAVSDGLAKVMVHVNDLRAKAARNARKKAPKASTPAKVIPITKAPAAAPEVAPVAAPGAAEAPAGPRRRKGDIRGL
jgi:hypothetical protein